MELASVSNELGLACHIANTCVGRCGYPRVASGLCSKHYWTLVFIRLDDWNTSFHLK